MRAPIEGIIMDGEQESLEKLRNHAKDDCSVCGHEPGTDPYCSKCGGRTEKDRLNKMAAEVMGFKHRVDNYGRIYYQESVENFNMQGQTIREKYWNPYSNPAHWDMVLDRMTEKGWVIETRQDSMFYRVEMFKYVSFEMGRLYQQAEAPLDQKGKAILLAVEKVLEGDK